MGWPPGPGSLDELFRWPAYNAEKLLLGSPNAAENRSSFEELLKHRIEIHDSYSGMGTGGATLHLQYKHMHRSTLR